MNRLLSKLLIFLFVLTLLPVSILLAAEKEPEIKISDLEIKGNNTISDGEIKNSVSTESPSIKPWVDKPVFDEQVLDNDMARIKELYDSHGFYDASVDYKLDYSDNRRSVKIRIDIKEGEPIILRNLEINVVGEAKPELKKKILKVIDLKVDKRFSSNKFQDSKAKIKNILSKEGYPRGSVDAQARVNRRLKWADTKITVDPGELYRFGQAHISGNEKISKGIIRREIIYHEGQIYSVQLISDTQSNIFETGFFKSVTIDSSLNEDSRTVDTFIRLTERKSGTVKTGIGFGTEDLLRGQITWTQRNFFGGGRVFQVGGKFSFITQRVQTSIKQPYVLGSNSDYKGILNFQRDDLPGYKGKSLNITNRFDKRISRELNAYTAFDLIYAKIDSQTTLTPLEQSQQNVYLTTISSGFDYINTDNVLNPSNGIVSLLDVEASLEQLGSDVDYFKTVFEIRGYKKFGDIVFAKRFKIGIIDAFGGTGDFDVPIFKRFFAGGSASMRGYPFQKLGPLNDQGDPLGGSSLLVGNLEARFPLFKDLGGVAFMDYGNVFSKSYDIKLNDLKYAAGIGFRYNTLVGPVRLDLGYALNPDDNFKRYQIFISVGQAF